MVNSSDFNGEGAQAPSPFARAPLTAVTELALAPVAKFGFSKAAAAFSGVNIFNFKSTLESALTAGSPGVSLGL